MLKQWREKKARDLGIDAGILANNTLLEALSEADIAKKGEAEIVVPMKRWQRELFGAELLELLLLGSHWPGVSSQPASVIRDPPSKTAVSPTSPARPFRSSQCVGRGRPARSRCRRLVRLLRRIIRLPDRQSLQQFPAAGTVCQKTSLSPLPFSSSHNRSFTGCLDPFTMSLHAAGRAKSPVSKEHPDCRAASRTIRCQRAIFSDSVHLRGLGQQNARQQTAQSPQHPIPSFSAG